MPSLKLFHRDPAKPTLRERAADLKAGLARIAGRAPAQEADTDRRAVVVGTLAAAIPLPALALSPPEVVPHPDQALLDAEAEHLRATAAAEAAIKASREARKAMHDALGPFPEELVMQGWEAIAFSKFYSPGFVCRVPTHIVPREDRLGNPDFGWTAEGLRQAIKLAPSAFGRAGQTPHEIRRWRGMLPLAEAYDTRRTDLVRRFRCQELAAEAEAAEAAQRRASRQVHAIPATTVDGLAVHTRRLASTAWYQDNSHYTALLLSAAAITGVALGQSDFDVAAWLAAWERIGGKVEWWAKSGEWAYVAPPLTVDDPQERKDEVRRLTYERGSNSTVVHRWLEDRKSDPRFARA